MARYTRDFVGSVRLVSRRTRVVEVFGPEPPGSRRPTDRQLLFDNPPTSLAEFLRGPESLGFCFEAEGRRAKFLIDAGPRGDLLLEIFARFPDTPARLA